ncbi:MAG: DUF885 domain-containing protein [bacterium]
MLRALTLAAKGDGMPIALDRRSRGSARRRVPLAPLVVCCVVALDGFATRALAEPTSGGGWVERSNANAQQLLAVQAAFDPESASRIGVPGIDEQVIDLAERFDLRHAEALARIAAELEQRLPTETDARVRQDLEILVEAARREQRQLEVRHRMTLPFLSPSALVFAGVQALLDEQTAPARRAAAHVRLRRYVGLEPGSTSVFELAKQRFRERANEADLLAPTRTAVEKEIADSATYTDGVRQLFQRWKLEGADAALAALASQASDHVAFMRDEVLPRARDDFRLPPELYQLALEAVGVDMPADELERRGRTAFVEIQTQMQSLAPRVAREKGWKLGDYRDVIRELKKHQLGDRTILAHYQKRAAALDEIIRRGRIVTLPERPMLIELASAAESAAIPAPHVRTPRLLGNTGERGVFVLPLRIRSGDGDALSFDDFSFEAASWTLTAHEGRPGHELQFARTIEQGVSIARAVFAFNSVNVEGWALYAEAEAQPYEPLEGQLIALQHRLMRAARAILDPALQRGTVTKDQAHRVLREDVVLSEAMTRQELDRYTFLAPGQATSYFVGYTRLLEIRAGAQLALGERFDRLAFNDFVLSRGLVPPRLLSKAVEEEFVPERRAVSESRAAADP